MKRNKLFRTKRSTLKHDTKSFNTRRRTQKCDTKLFKTRRNTNNCHIYHCVNPRSHNMRSDHPVKLNKLLSGTCMMTYWTVHNSRFIVMQQIHYKISVSTTYATAVLQCCYIPCVTLLTGISYLKFTLWFSASISTEVTHSLFNFANGGSRLTVYQMIWCHNEITTLSIKRQLKIAYKMLHKP